MYTVCISNFQGSVGPIERGGVVYSTVYIRATCSSSNLHPYHSCHSEISCQRKTWCHMWKRKSINRNFNVERKLASVSKQTELDDVASANGSSKS